MFLLLSVVVATKSLLMDFKKTNNLINQYVIEVIKLLDGGNHMYESRENSSKKLLDDRDLLQFFAYGMDVANDYRQLHSKVVY